MPCNILIYDVPDACDNIDTHLYKLCLPPVKDCSPQCLDFDIKECDQLWDCNLCQTETPYQQPWTPGDLIQFQFQFIDTYNDNQEIPVNGWGTFVRAELCDAETGAVVSATHSTFADCWLVGWNGETSYQLIQINTTSEHFLNLNCWNIRVRAYDKNNQVVKEYCSEKFRRHACNDTMIIRGDYTSYDCCGNYYGEPVAYVGNKSFTYNNQRRYFGFVLNDGTRVTKERFGDKIRNIEVNTVFLLKIDRFVPPYVKTMLLNQHLAAEVIIIDEIEYRADSYSVTNENRRSRMFFFDVEIIGICELTPGCN